MGVVITSLEHGQRGGRQHLGQALEVGHVLLLPGKYVDYLIRTEKTQTISVCVCVGGGWGGLPAGPGQGSRPEGSRCRSDRASRSAGPPRAQSPARGFGRTYRTLCTPPGGERGREGSWRLNKASRAERSELAALPLYLDHLRVLEPPAEEGLDQGEHLLQHHDHLKANHLGGYSTCPPPSGKHPCCTYWILCALGGGGGLAGRPLKSVRLSGDVQSGEEAGQHPQDVDDGLFISGIRL